MGAGAGGLGWLDWAGGISGTTRLSTASSVLGLATSGATWVTSHEDGSVNRWVRHGDSFERTHQWSRPKGWNHAVAVCPGTGDVAIAMDRGEIAVWRPTSDETPRRLRGHERSVLSLACSSDGRRLLSGGFEGATLLWQLDDLTAAPTRLTVGDSPVYAVAWDTSGPGIVAAGGMGVTRWPSPSDVPQTLSDRPHQVLAVVAGLYAGVADDATVSVWSEGGILRLQLSDGAAGRVQGLSIAPDGRSLRLLEHHRAWSLPLEPDPQVVNADALLARVQKEAGDDP